MQVTREITIHSALRHAHIIDLYAAFEDADNVYLVQEFAYGAQQCQAWSLPRLTGKPHLLCPHNGRGPTMLWPASAGRVLVYNGIYCRG